MKRKLSLSYFCGPCEIKPRHGCTLSQLIISLWSSWEDILHQRRPQSSEEITGFRKFPGETFGEALKHLKELRRRCPHGLTNCLLLRFVCNDLEENQRIENATAGGSLLDTTITLKTLIIEERQMEMYTEKRGRKG